MVYVVPYIEEETKGWYSKERGRGQCTRFKPSLRNIREDWIFRRIT